MKASRTSFERWITDNPPLSDSRYISYVAKGGRCWGHWYREKHAKEFNKRYQTFWLKHPELWEADIET
jgi:hypothetical protein